MRREGGTGEEGTAVAVPALQGVFEGEWVAELVNEVGEGGEEMSGWLGIVGRGLR